MPLLTDIRIYLEDAKPTGMIPRYNQAVILKDAGNLAAAKPIAERLLEEIEAKFAKRVFAFALGESPKKEFELAESELNGILLRDLCYSYIDICLLQACCIDDFSTKRRCLKKVKDLNENGFIDGARLERFKKTSAFVFYNQACEKIKEAESKTKAEKVVLYKRACRLLEGSVFYVPEDKETRSLLARVAEDTADIYFDLAETADSDAVAEKHFHASMTYYQKSEELLKKVRREPGLQDPNVLLLSRMNAVVLYLECLLRQGKTDEVLSHCQQVIKEYKQEKFLGRKVDPLSRGQFLETLFIIYDSRIKALASRSVSPKLLLKQKECRQTWAKNFLKLYDSGRLVGYEIMDERLAVMRREANRVLLGQVRPRPEEAGKAEEAEGSKKPRVGAAGLFRPEDAGMAAGAGGSASGASGVDKRLG